MNVKIMMITGILLATSSGSFAASPSFDCANATSRAEKLICSDKGLAEVDGMLALAYKEWLAHAPDKEATKQRQIEWLKNERNQCADAACIQRAYDTRFEELSTRTRRNADGSPVGSEVSTVAESAASGNQSRQSHAESNTSTIENSVVTAPQIPVSGTAPAKAISSEENTSKTTEANINKPGATST